MENNKTSVYKEATDKIITLLMQGNIPWRQPYYTVNSKKVNWVTGKEYQGINKLLLPEVGEYLTFAQAKNNKGNVKKDAKGHLIVKCDKYIPKEDKETALKLQAEGKDIKFLMKTYLKKVYVFNIKDTEGIKSKFEPGETKPAENPTLAADIVTSDYLKNGFRVEDGNSIAFNQENGTLTCPQKNRFLTEEEYYNAVIYGMVCNELYAAKPKRDKAQAELTAEICASMVLNSCGLQRKEATENAAAKCKQWIEELNNDCRFIFTAAKEAETIAKKIMTPLDGVKF